MALSAKVAVQPLTWGKTPFDQVIKEAAEAGYAGIEVGVGDGTDLAALKKQLGDHGLEATSSYTSIHPFDGAKAAEGSDRVVRAGERLKELGASVVVIAGDFVRQVPSTESHARADVQSFAETVNKVGARLNAIGMTAVVHNHIHTILERPEEIDWFSDATDPALVSWGFDTAQLSAGGADAVEYFARHKERVKYVHLKDRKIGLDTYGNFAELGTGFISFPSILEILDTANYEGWLVTELDQSLTTPFQSVKANRDYLRTLGV